jgi:hypothetical protein
LTVFLGAGLLQVAGSKVEGKALNACLIKVPNMHTLLDHICATPKRSDEVDQGTPPPSPFTSFLNPNLVAVFKKASMFP